MKEFYKKLSELFALEAQHASSSPTDLKEDIKGLVVEAAVKKAAKDASHAELGDEGGFDTYEPSSEDSDAIEELYPYAKQAYMDAYETAFYKACPHTVECERCNAVYTPEVEENCPMCERRDFEWSHAAGRV